MCGIFGLWHTDKRSIAPAVVQQATTTLKHRGPDDEGYLFANTDTRRVVACAGLDTDPALELRPVAALAGEAYDLAFGFRRLAILDLSPAGHQPMGCDQGRYWLVFNGEIYNYVELRSELKRLGHTFRSTSDSEVLLTAYRQWGRQALNRLVGMFSLAIFDAQQRMLFLARDFFGIKPLYYTFWPGNFAFASEIKALLELPGVERRANPQRVYDYLRFQLTDHGRETLFVGIYQLPAAHYLEIPLDRPDDIPQPSRYWQIDLTRRSQLSFAEAGQRLRDLFLNNIKLHLRSDVPVGAALSGGVDSSAIVASMRHLQGQDLDLYAFSYIASDPKISEERWIDLISRASQATTHKMQPKSEELVSDLTRLISIQDEPFGSTSIYAQFRVFQAAQQARIKVMLDGQGADELLAGYFPYLAARLGSLLRQIRWLAARRFLGQAAHTTQNGKFPLLLEAAKLLLPPHFQKVGRQLAGKSLYPPWINGDWLAEQGVNKQFHWHFGRDVLREQLHTSVAEISLPMLLRYEDRNSMAYSIESRVPFLTPDLVNFVFALPESFMIAPDTTTKAIFRQAMRGIVPDAILDRRDKIGFQTPEKTWLTDLRPWVEGVLNSDAAHDIPALQLSEIDKEWQAILQGRTMFDFRVWRWVNLIQWVDQYQVAFG